MQALGPEEPPSTHLIFPGFQLQLLQAKEPLWSEGPPEPRRGDSVPPSLVHTPPFSLAPPSKGADPTLVGGPPDWEAGPAGGEVDKTWPPLAPSVGDRQQSAALPTQASAPQLSLLTPRLLVTLVGPLGP